MSNKPIEETQYWMAGRNWNELRSNDWHDGAELNDSIIADLKKESEHGIIVFWHDDDDGTIENGHLIEW